MSAIPWIAAGGAVGVVLRYLLASGLQRLAVGSYPVGTLAVNVAGCLGIGLLVAWLEGPLQVRDEMRLALLVGLLGGFTTFSTFGLEALALIDEGELLRGASYVLLSNGLGLGAVWLGLRVAGG